MCCFFDSRDRVPPFSDAPPTETESGAKALPRYGLAKLTIKRSMVQAERTGLLARFMQSVFRILFRLHNHC